MNTENTLNHCEQKAKGTGEDKPPYSIMLDKLKNIYMLILQLSYKKMLF